MKKRTIYASLMAWSLLVCVAIFVGILDTRTNADLSIIVVFSAQGVLASFVIFLVNLIKISKLKMVKVYTDNSDSKQISMYVPQIIFEFDKIVRTNFPELSYAEEYHCPSFLYTKLSKEIQFGRPSISTLQSILIDMEQHIGLIDNKSIIMLEQLADDRAGYIEKNFYSFNEITVGFHDMYTADTYLAVIAHELSHAYQFSKGSQFLYSDEIKKEQFTDALTFYFGFGLITKKGKTIRKERITDMTATRTSYETQTVTLGYLNPQYFHDLETMVKDYRITQHKTKKVIKEIDSLLYAISLYLSEIENTLNELKNKKINSNQLGKIQEIIIMFDPFYLNSLKIQIGNYRKIGFEENNKKMIFLRKEMSKLIDIKSYLSSL